MPAQLDRPSVPPSPNVSGIVRQASIQVGHYTGVAGTSIPLGELPGRDIMIPVSLNYHASGIKVQDVASSYGLGWNLQAGGAITRVVQGIPDGIVDIAQVALLRFMRRQLILQHVTESVISFSFHF